MRALVIVLVGLLACDDAAPRAPAPAPPPAPAAPATPVAPAPVAWIGVVAPAATVDVAPRFDGVLARVAVQGGEVVAAGDVIAVLDDRPLREELALARAAARQAGAGARRAAVEAERARHRLSIEERGLADGTTAQAVADDTRFAARAAEAAAGMARAEASEARARVDRARAALADTAVRAPFAGTIAARYHDPGAAVGPRAPVVRLVGDGPLRIRFAVAPADAARVGPGTRVRAELDGRGAVEAIVEHVAPELDQASQRVFVDAALAAPVTGLTPGLPAQVHLAGEPPR